MFERIHILKKSRAIVFDFSITFVVASRVFAVEQFGIRLWKANEKTNLMIKIKLKFKIGRLQPEKSPNMFERIQIMHAVYTVTPHPMLLSSRGLARKVWTMVLTLKLTREPKNAMRPGKVRLHKGLRGSGLK